LEPSFKGGKRKGDVSRDQTRTLSADTQEDAFTTFFEAWVGSPPSDQFPSPHDHRDLSTHQLHRKPPMATCTIKNLFPFEGPTFAHSVSKKKKKKTFAGFQ
jgi:hypothetical protein